MERVSSKWIYVLGGVVRVVLVVMSMGESGVTPGVKLTDVDYWVMGDAALYVH